MNKQLSRCTVQENIGNIKTGLVHYNYPGMVGKEVGCDDE